MDYYGLDVHKRYTTYTHMNSEGVILGQGKIPNEGEAFRCLLARASDGAKVAMEATGNWYHLYDLLEGLAKEVVLAHPLQVRAIAAARIKTDKVDATTLAHLLRSDLIPAAYIPPRPVRQMRELLRYRADLVKQRTALKNRVHALLAKQGLFSPYSDAFGKSGRRWLASLPLPPIARQALDGYLAVLDSLSSRIQEANSTIAAQVEASPQARLLTSLPGIGFYSALLILAEIGDIRRFPSARHLVSFAGLAPRVRSSGGRTRYGPITKQGSSSLRWVLTEAAQCAARRPGHLQAFHQRVARRKGKPTATIALARYLLTIIYSMLVHNQPYRERR